MEKELLEDIIEWDIINWSKALKYWKSKIDIVSKNYYCLELGGRKGGPSLWLALNGNNVICSDLESPDEIASVLHKKYQCEDVITYEAIDATNIPYQDHFDIVIFKSILGGISRNGKDKLKAKTIFEIHKSMKPGGKLLFAENLESSFLHKFLRKQFVKWGDEWNYLKYADIDNLFSSFTSVKFITVGFFGAFGRTERQRQFLGRADNIFEKVVPQSSRYIVIGVAEK
jgi:SAM-dependent methyltransferase